MNVSLLGYDDNIYALLAESVPMDTRDEIVEGINDRLGDVELYELAAKEIEQSGVVQGLWVKALAEAKNNQEEAKALYPQITSTDVPESERCKNSRGRISPRREKTIRRKRSLDANEKSGGKICYAH